MRFRWLILCLLLSSCIDEDHTSIGYLFEELQSNKTNITFQNNLEYTEELNVYTFRNFYNGAGVAIGDLNNDGLADIYFCGNQVDNKLYINKGDFEFVDITERAGVASENIWSTGVTLVDINADGFLDIYVCKSGDMNGANRHNELFINEGITETDENGIALVSFSERSKEYGLDDVGLSTHAAFLDYDLDGDLDCYLLNNSFKSVGNYDLIEDQRNVRDPDGGNKLLRNNTVEGFNKDEFVFEDISESAGIYGSSIGFGLGVTVGDINADGWPDIFVSNDFFEKDYLYINQKDGSFEESIEAYIGELSLGSMGADLADINNDGLSDLFVTEMLPYTEERLKSKAQFQNWNAYTAAENAGYHKQFARNVLQLNLGAGKFAEIGRYAGVENTDWSWGALIFDMDSDGHKDLFVANGIYKDLLDQDYINFYSNPAEVRKILFDKSNGGIDKLIDKMPSQPIPNYAFKNIENNKFERINAKWGFTKESFSNGAAYGDLDNDGDLDLVVNNINMPPSIYRNKTRDQHFLKFKLTDSSSKNYYALSSKLKLYYDNEIQSHEIQTTKGFMSSVEPTLTFGLGEVSIVDSVEIIWPDQTITKLYDVKSDTLIRIEKENVASVKANRKNVNKSIFLKKEDKIEFVHSENNYSDFDKESLLFTMNSNLGPACCKGDINNDGLIDFYIGGAAGQAGRIYLQTKSNSFAPFANTVFSGHEDSEDTDCIFFDANNDGYMDLFVTSGSSEFGPNNSALADRLYFNKNGSDFELSGQILPSFRFENSSAVVSLDLENDGDQDLVVTSFIRPYLYGPPSDMYLLQNNGSGVYKDISMTHAPEFKNLGLLTDVAAADVDSDDDIDLIVTGQWMSPQLFINDKGYFSKKESALGELNGFWNCISYSDLDKDGDIDFVLGNLGLNTMLSVRDEMPMHMYVNDFDKNGTVEQIITYTTSDGEFPLAQRNDLLTQLPTLRKKYQNFGSYANQTVDDIFSRELLEEGLVLKVTESNSAVLWNNGEGDFSTQPLPIEAQMSPVYSILIGNFDQDDSMEIILGGNQYLSKPQIGINDASKGLALKAITTKEYKAMSIEESGLNIDGQIREMINLSHSGSSQILIARNNNNPLLFSYNNENL